MQRREREPKAPKISVEEVKLRQLKKTLLLSAQLTITPEAVAGAEGNSNQLLSPCLMWGLA